MEILGPRCTVAQERCFPSWTGKGREVRLSKRGFDAVDRATPGDNLQDSKLAAGCEPPHPDRTPAIRYAKPILAFELGLAASDRWRSQKHEAHKGRGGGKRSSGPDRSHMCSKSEESLGPADHLPVDHGFIPELDFVGPNSAAAQAAITPVSLGRRR